MDMYEKFGNDWLGKYTEDQRRAIAQEVINQGAAKQVKGDVNIDWSSVDPSVAGILDGTYKPQVAAPIQPMAGTPAPQPTAATTGARLPVQSSWLSKFAKK